MLKVEIKYCGGCNPYYDRVALVERIKSRLKDRAEFVSPSNDDVDLVLAVQGCQTACADLSPFQSQTIHIITRIADAEKLIERLLLPP
jgi:hypothetical protein